MKHRPTGAYLPIGQLDGDYCTCGKWAHECPECPTTPPDYAIVTEPTTPADYTIHDDEDDER